MVGRGFASIVNSTTGSTDTGNFITTLVKITAYIGPFFFPPKAFPNMQEMHSLISQVW